jgi:alpha-ketoglutarate-dependent taurine dioxygenase
MLNRYTDVWIQPLLENRDFPVCIRPAQRGVELGEWVALHHVEIARLIARHGAILFRGFDVGDVGRFERIAAAASASDWVEYREAATPRSHVRGNVFTSTEYPQELRIYVHNENSHVTSWPLYVFFYCQRPADSGGETPLADCREIYRQLPREIVRGFEASGWLYRRNFLRTSAIPWTKAFNTDSRQVVDDYCRENFMHSEWSRNGLSLIYRRWATLQHPLTGDPVWFNHGTFFNIWTLEPELKEIMLQLPQEFLPHNTYHGHGEPVADDIMRLLDEAYTRHTVTFHWETDDVLMVDNMRLAHGRKPYSGQRRIFVAMQKMISCASVAQRMQYAWP